jgi:3-oxoacyl-[acyl-carrier protein] reductase
VGAIIQVNLTGAFLCWQQAARTLSRRPWRRIISIVSLSGQKGGVGRSAYGASSGQGPQQDQRSSSRHGINVNHRAWSDHDGDRQGMHTPDGGGLPPPDPQRRYGEPAKSRTPHFLASVGVHITSHTLNVDGGFLAAG